MIILLDSKSKGFLSEFINSSYKRYTEPQKKGVPKGDPIGYTTAKNGAVLLDLTSLSIKEQAEVLHTSYGVLEGANSDRKTYRKNSLYQYQK